MYQTLFALLLLQAVGSAGDTPTVQKSTLVVSTVKRGELVQMVRGLGVLTAERTAELKIAGSDAGQLQVGQKAAVDTPQGTVTGELFRVHPKTVDDEVVVEVRLNSAPPSGMGPGRAVDGTISILTLKDVIYVGGPADRLSALEKRADMLFRLEPDGQHAVATKVEFGLTGRSSGETGFDKVIEIRSGLQPGDTVVISDMSSFNGKARVRVQ